MMFASMEEYELVTEEDNTNDMEFEEHTSTLAHVALADTWLQNFLSTNSQVVS